MADHLDAPGLKAPGMNAATDITDIYAFQSGGGAKTVLIMGVNPLAPTLASTFDPNAMYQLLIDTDGDALAEIGYTIMFQGQGNSQTATVYRITADDVESATSMGTAVVSNAPVSLDANAQNTTQNGYQFFAGIRSDPFFFDLMGFLNGFKFTGADFFADKNIFGIVLEVPNSELGTNAKIGVWGRTLAGGTQVDRMGRPAINTVFNKEEAKNTFNKIKPTQDRQMFMASFVATLKALGNSDQEANNLAMVLLPDILTYDYSSAAGFLNGRKLTDDVIDAELNLLTKGAIKTDMVGPHTDYLAAFPYLGNPHAAAQPAPQPAPAPAPAPPPAPAPAPSPVPSGMPNTGEGGGDDDQDRRVLE